VVYIYIVFYVVLLLFILIIVMMSVVSGMKKITYMAFIIIIIYLILYNFAANTSNAVNMKKRFCTLVSLLVKSIFWFLSLLFLIVVA